MVISNYIGAYVFFFCCNSSVHNKLVEMSNEIILVFYMLFSYYATDVTKLVMGKKKKKMFF